MRAMIPPEIPPLLFSLYSVIFLSPPVSPFPEVSPPYPVVSVLFVPVFPPSVSVLFLLVSHLGRHLSPMHSGKSGPTHFVPFPEVSVLLFFPEESVEFVFPPVVSVVFVFPPVVSVEFVFPPVVSVVFVFPPVVSVVFVFPPVVSVLFFLLQFGPSQTQAYPSSHVS